MGVTTLSSLPTAPDMSSLHTSSLRSKYPLFQPPRKIYSQGISARAGKGVKVLYANTSQTALAAQIAAQADIAIVFVATTSSEGHDRFVFF